MNTILIPIILSLIVNISAGGSLQKTAPQRESSLFLAIYPIFKSGDAKEFKVLIYDVNSQKFVFSKKIDVDGDVDYSANNTQSPNDAVQFNPKTKDIFFATSGVNEYTGACINKDKTCFTRIYRINMDDTKPSLVFQTESFIDHWIVDSTTNSILINLYHSRKEPEGLAVGQMLKKINASHGREIFSKVHMRSAFNISTKPSEFMLTADGKYVYQTILETYKKNNKFDHNELGLIRIDMQTGEIHEERITDKPFFALTNISPDNRYFAFSGNPKGELMDLLLYDLSNKKITIIPRKDMSVANYFLAWSGDGKKLFYKSKGLLHYYDMNLKKSFSFSGEIATTSPRKFTTDSRYFVFGKTLNDLKLYDLATNQITPLLNEPNGFYVKGVLWF